MKELKSFEYPRKIIPKIDPMDFLDFIKIKQQLDPRCLINYFALFDELGELDSKDMKHMTNDEME